MATRWYILKESLKKEGEVYKTFALCSVVDPSLQRDLYFIGDKAVDREELISFAVGVGLPREYVVAVLSDESEMLLGPDWLRLFAA